MPIGIGEAKGTTDVETSHLGYLRVKSGSATPERPIVRRIFWQVAASCLLATAGVVPISAFAEVVPQFQKTKKKKQKKRTTPPRAADIQFSFFHFLFRQPPARPAVM